MSLIRVGRMENLAGATMSVMGAGAAAGDENYAVTVGNFGVGAPSRGPRASSTRPPRPTPPVRGLALSRLRLTKGFDGILSRVFHSSQDVYFLAWCWDFSGQPPHFYPGTVGDPGACLIKLKAGQEREFMGSGILLSPPREVVGGLCARIQLWESDAGPRDFGKKMVQVARRIEKSPLQEQLESLAPIVAASGNVPVAMIPEIEKLAVALSKEIGNILTKNADDHVDYYEGYFRNEDAWTPPQVTYRADATEIVLSRV